MTKSESGKLGAIASTIVSNKNKNNREKKYLINPNKCQQCYSILSYDKKNNKFCNRSCAATFNNTGRTHPPRSKEFRSNIAKQNRSRNHPKTHIVFSNCIHCGLGYFYPKPGSTRNYCSRTCLSSNLSERARNNPKFGGRCYHVSITRQDSYGNKVILDSSYEDRVASILDSNKINWIRPNFINYSDSEGTVRKYFPDFYLVDYNLYLDPKNDFLIEKDKDKLNLVQTQNDIRIIVISNEEITNDFIVSLCAVNQI